MKVPHRARCVIALLSAVTFTPATAAPSLALDYAQWDYSVDGSARDADSEIDFSRDLAVRPRSRGSYALDWRPTPGGLPELSARYTPIAAGGMKTVSGPGGLAGPIPGGTTTVAADADLEDMELTLRYPFAGPRLRLALGLTLRRLRGDILIQEEGQADATRERIGRSFPLLHAELEWRPLAWLGASAQGSHVAHGDDRATDYRVQVSAEWRALRLSGGWLSKSFRLQGAPYLLDAELAGPYAGLGLVFRN